MFSYGFSFLRFPSSCFSSLASLVFISYGYFTGFISPPCFSDVDPFSPCLLDWMALRVRFHVSFSGLSVFWAVLTHAVANDG